MSASVLTQHNDNQRTGTNPDEPTLAPDAVKARFRRLADLPVDPPGEGGPAGWNAQVVAQPLLAAGVDFGGGVRKDVLVVATMHGTVYAFDATHKDDPAFAYPRLWAVWLGTPVLAPPGDQKDMFGTNPEWGILSTPAVDAGRKRVYVVMWNDTNGGAYRLHSLDLTTGAHVAGPRDIQGGDPGPHGDVPFDPVFQKQRPALLLVRPEDVPDARRAGVGPDGTVYVGFGASIEMRGNYHGWVFACDARTLQVRGRPWCATPATNKGGVWQAGQGPAATPDGDVVVMTGDGPFDGSADFGQSVVKLSGADLRVLDFFTPWNGKQESDADDDLGSAGPLYIAAGPFVVGGGKTGVLYCLDPNRMGGAGDVHTRTDHALDAIHATADPPVWHGHPPPGVDHDHHVHGSPVYFAPLRRLYVWGENDVLRAFTLDAHGKFNPRVPRFGDVVAPSGMPGGMLALTSDGDARPVLWALMPAPAPFDPNDPLKADANQRRLVRGVLRAIDAATLKEVWNSDGPGGGLPWHFAKFSPPTVAGGRAYVPTYDGRLVVFGPG